MLTLEYVKEFMRIDHDEEDGYLSVLLLLAKELCENYMRSPLPEAEVESIKQAQLLVISHFFENRNGWSRGNESISSYNLADPSRAAELLTDDDNYYGWDRS